jgi:predicted dehydrogenase
MNFRARNNHETIKIGLVGAGNIGQAYVQALLGCTTARIVAVADIRPETARATAEMLGCAAFESHEAMVDGCSLDAVIVCTPPITHPEVCIFFLNRGIHVLCEKPLSVDVESAKLMLQTADDAGVILTMASKFRYAEDVVRAKSVVASGILGDVILFENVFASRVDMSARWNAVPTISGGGVLIDNGTHSVDIMRYLVGPIVEVDIVEGKRSQGLTVEETVLLTARTKSGAMGSIDLSWSINKERESYIGIFGTQGTVSIGWKSSKYRQASSRDWIVFGNGYDKLQAFRAQIENFCRAILGREALIITEDDALASVRVIEAAYLALRQRRWTPVHADPIPFDNRPFLPETVAQAA